MISKETMIEKQLKGRDIRDENVLRAMAEIDREDFVPDEMKEYAYEDGPLPIGRKQTISQPYIVAYMAQHLDLRADHKVLEVGTGCGYNAAVISRIVSHVYSMEIIEWLAELAKKNLKKAHIENVTAAFGDAYQGWPEHAPFDRIVLTAAAPYLPEPLKEQLKVGGKMLAPLQDGYQKLILLEKTAEDRFRTKDLIPVRFVPMTGKAQE